MRVGLQRLRREEHGTTRPAPAAPRPRLVVRLAKEARLQQAVRPQQAARPTQAVSPNRPLVGCWSGIPIRRTRACRSSIWMTVRS